MPGPVPGSTSWLHPGEKDVDGGEVLFRCDFPRIGATLNIALLV